jgi:hypothetical protein
MSWGTIGFVATGTVVTAMLGVWVGAQIAGRAALGSQTKADTEALPFCPTRWNPTSLSRTLGPRETVGVTADDLDADGHVDAIFANQLDESLSIYWGDGSARLGTPDTLAVGRVSAAPTVGDIDGDGRRDLLVPDADHSELRPFLQSDGRRFVASIPIQHPDLNTDGPPALLRWDSDGILDLLVVAEGGLKIRRGLRDGDFEDVQIDISSQVVPYAVVRRRDGPDAVLLGGTDPHTVEADTRAVAVRKTTWPDMRGTPLVWSSRLFMSTGSELTELASDGTACAFATTPIPTTLLVDLDADGTPEGLTADTCSGCTSNHIVVGGG